MASYNVELRKRTGSTYGDIVKVATDWSLIANKPSTFTPTSHTHTASEVGLGNVTNESKATMFTNPTFTGRATVATDGGVDINAGNTALDFLRVRYNAGDTYGFNFRYKGDESGDNNALEIHSSTARALRVQQSGLVKFDYTPQAGGQNLVKTDDSRLSDARPASDVSSWAKASTKPTYSYQDVGAPSTTGHGASGTWGINITGEAPASKVNSASYAITGSSYNSSDMVKNTLYYVTTTSGTCNIYVEADSYGGDFEVGDQITIVRVGNGMLAIVGGTRVLRNINGSAGTGTFYIAKYQAVTLLKVGTDSWVAIGALSGSGV